MEGTTRIGVIGDFNPANATHIATNLGIEHAGESLGRHFEVVWLPTDEPQEFGSFHGLFCSPGSPYKSLEGALTGVQSARENKIPFIGTCGGFQHMVLEFAQNVMGVRDAGHAETDPSASHLFITPLSCSLVGKTMDVCLKPESRAAEVYRAPRAMEAYYCNFGLNPDYRDQLEGAGLDVSGRDEGGEVRIMELPSHPFFVGTLFVPQARSLKGNPHPLVLAFCRAAAAGG